MGVICQGHFENLRKMGIKTFLSTILISLNFHLIDNTLIVEEIKLLV